MQALKKTDRKYKRTPEKIDPKQKKRKHRLLKTLFVIAAGAVLFALYMTIYAAVLGKDLPKTAVLRRQNADWQSRMEQMGARLDRDEEVLSLLEVRDDRIYRSVYGMDEIPAAVRSAGIGGNNRYAALEVLDRGHLLRRTASRLDDLAKRAYVQSKSLDDVAALAQQAGDKAAHIPAIPPMSTAPGSFHLSSPFGYRSDPITGVSKFHSGMDFACPPGNTIYAVGDGVVESASSDFFGYGNIVIVNHGFGYKSRYAHMSRIAVHEGQKVTRGTILGETGQSGRVTGPHLHYEIMYRDDFVNPYDFMDLDLSAKDYAEIIAQSTKNHEKE